MNLKIIFIFAIFLNTSFISCSFTLGAGLIGGTTAALYASFGTLYCSFRECCTIPKNQDDTNAWVKRDLKGLQASLKEQVHGQHLVSGVLLRALHAHFSDKRPAKALVMSFHGWMGGGKNFVARLIAENLYKNGMKSKYVHLFSSTVHFPHEDKVDIYKIQIQDWIRGNASECEHTLYIFDEIDKMPLGMMDAIKPFIDYHDEIFGINFRHSIFIFLSNTGSNLINERMILNWREGKDRSSIKFEDMEKLAMDGAFNENGGLHNSELIRHSLVDYYIPFLPMERSHIEMCIRDEFLRKGIIPSTDMFEKVKNSLLYFPPGTGVFSTTGCKRISQKIGYLLAEQDFENFYDEPKT